MEADLHRHFNNCIKNPGHMTFIPSNKFSVEDLPSHCHDTNLLFDCISSVSDLTVRVAVKYVSPRRPATVPGSDTPYPGYLIRGTRRMTVGTGWVHSVYRFPDKYNYQLRTCPCRDCRNSSEQIKEFALIRIQTAAHVIFDDLEVEHTTCHLFFHRGGNPQTCSGVITLCGVWRVFSDINTDRCSMITVTHDMELAARLERLTIYRDYLKESYIIKSLLYPSPEEVQNQHDALVCLVSHPHGCSSNISVGVTVDTKMVEAGRISYMYTTPTCPGSSGGKIFIIWKDLRLWGFEHTHSHGSCMEQEQINHSSHGVGYLPPIHSHAGNSSPDSPTNSQVQQETRGPGEVQECLPETDLHSCFMVCTKNPGHKNFTPIEAFSEQHLPPDRHHLVEHIKVLGNIVALVEVKKVSRERPKTFPGSSIEYPRSAQRGSAWIYKVLTFGNRSGVYMGRCTCETCRISDNSKKHFAYIIIHTAAHVVFDEFEGKHTTCSLFYNKGKTLEACAGVVKLSGMSRVWSDVEKDVCKMLYVTHDQEVIDRVEKVVNEWENARRSLELMNKIQFSQESSSTVTNRQALAITVSHPHGCSKQVSIGQCVSIEDSGNGQTVYTYTTPTCPGSSGAYLFVEGRDWQSWDDHVHCGGSEDRCGINYCK